MKDEGIVIGDGIVITIAEIDGDDVRLNVEHPPEVQIKRSSPPPVLQDHFE